MCDRACLLLLLLLLWLLFYYSAVCVLAIPHVSIVLSDYLQLFDLTPTSLQLLDPTSGELPSWTTDWQHTLLCIPTPRVYQRIPPRRTTANTLLLKDKWTDFLILQTNSYSIKCKFYKQARGEHAPSSMVRFNTKQLTQLKFCRTPQDHLQHKPPNSTKYKENKQFHSEKLKFKQLTSCWEGGHTSS